MSALLAFLRQHRALSIVVFVCVLVNLAAVLWLRGWWLHWVAVGALALWVGAPAVIGCALGYPVRRSSRVTSVLFRAAAIVAAVALSPIVSLLPGRYVVQHDIAAAQRYCESFIPALEAYRKEHRRYPSDFSTMPQNRRPPRLVSRSSDRPCEYYSDGTSFGFNFVDPRGMMNWIGYNSENGTWRAWH